MERQVARQTAATQQEFNPFTPFPFTIPLEKINHDRLVVEASTIGLRPGQWPRVLCMWGPNNCLGPVTFENPSFRYDQEGDLVGVIYTGRYSRRELRVIND